MNIKEWPTSKFKEYPKNPRLNDHAVKPLVAMIQEFGFRVPLLATSDGEVVDGHLRLKAARQIGLKKLPVILVDDLSPEQIRALRIAINKSAELADWDMPLLRAEVQELSLANYDLALLSFSQSAVDHLLMAPEQFVPDQIQGGLDQLKEHVCPQCGFKFR